MVLMPAAVHYVTLVMLAALDIEVFAGWRWQQAKAGH